MTSLAEVVSGAYTYAPRVDAWLGGDWLGQVPVRGGSVAWSSSQQVQGTLTLQVPLVGAARGEPDRDWTPSSPQSPLAPYGQTLQVTVLVASTITDETWVQPVGTFLITAVETDSSSVSVTGKSLLQHCEEDRLTAPTTPRQGGTLASELSRLVAGYMPVSVDDQLVDRACPSSMSWGESRIDALYEIADTWPARLREGMDGVLYVLPPVDEITTVPARLLTDGEGGTVVGAPRSLARDQVYNRVVARGQDQDDQGKATFQAVADQETGPLAVSGPYGVVTRFYSSPLITSTAVAASTARTMLAQSVRRTSTVPVEHAPDPTITLDEPVAVMTHPAEGAAAVVRWGRVTAFELPLVHSSTARTDVEVVS